MMPSKHYRDSDEFKDAVGRAIASTRKSIGMTRGQVANELSTTETTIYRWETGRATPGLHDLNALASVYNTTVSNFVSPSDAAQQATDLINRKEDNDNDK